MHARGLPGHYVLGQSSVLAKLIEGEMVVPRPEPIPGNQVPWDPDPYRLDPMAGAGEGEVIVGYKGQTQTEPVRDQDRRWANLWHINGRFRV